MIERNQSCIGLAPSPRAVVRRNEAQSHVQRQVLGLGQVEQGARLWWKLGCLRLQTAEVKHGMVESEDENNNVIPVLSWVKLCSISLRPPVQPLPVDRDWPSHASLPSLAAHVFSALQTALLVDFVLRLAVHTALDPAPLDGFFVWRRSRWLYRIKTHMVGRQPIRRIGIV